ncbi:hypothetical protein ALC62_09404 [Cyphomyrmex costatus]|uniref:Uncharacterized protein n=1 Tax=Cyphomyrmex costatus TaxID=456900 RepID=A0A195CH78_9HYME|nr:hypothetical protein ALC62_09404 [Cyphomyrmex costatus]
MATYEIGERSRRRKLNEDEEDAEEAAVHERVMGERGKDTDRPRRGNLRRRTAVARRTERWKSILWNRSVFLKPCSELQPGEVRREQVKNDDGGEREKTKERRTGKRKRREKRRQ